MKYLTRNGNEAGANLSLSKMMGPEERVIVITGYDRYDGMSLVYVNEEEARKIVADLSEILS